MVNLIRNVLLLIPDTNTSTGAKTDTVAKNNKPFEESDTDTSELLNQITIYNSDSDISPLPSPVTQLDKQYSKCGVIIVSCTIISYLHYISFSKNFSDRF